MRLAERYGPLMSIWVSQFPTIVVFTPDTTCEVLRNADLAGHTVRNMWCAEGHAASSIIFLPVRVRWQVRQHVRSCSPRPRPLNVVHR
jgi:hypothetical protein